MTTCIEAAHYMKCREENYASPEMVEAAKNHVAICVFCGGTMPGQEDLQAIFKDMFTRVGHDIICKDPKCKHDDDSPSEFEREVVKQFRKS